MHRIKKMMEINRSVIENLKETQEVLMKEMEKVNFNLERLGSINDILSTYPTDAPSEKNCNRNHNHNHNHHKGRPHTPIDENRKGNCEKNCKRKPINKNYEIEFSIPMIEIDDLYDLNENEDLLEDLFEYLNI